MTKAVDRPAIVAGASVAEGAGRRPTAPNTDVEVTECPRRGAETTATDAVSRRHLLGVWSVVGSAVILALAVVIYEFVRNGGHPPYGDMIGHAATAEWLRTLPWWDWRGWSDWFYGGQAIGVNYPPLPHAVARFVHPGYGQLAAVAVGLLVLLPWSAIRLARSVGYEKRSQLFAVGATLLLAGLAGFVGWLLPGFGSVGYYGSWPAMFAAVCGLFCAGWAACCRRPVLGGVIAGFGVLWNLTVMGGVAMVCAALLATSGASIRQALRWAATAFAAALAVCAWWLVPFVAAWDRLVRWEIPHLRWWSGTVWGIAAVATIGIAAAWTVRLRMAASSRLTIAAALGIFVSLVGELFGLPRVERWMVLPIVVAVIAVAEVLATQPRTSTRRPRPAWSLIGAALLVVFVIATRRFEVLALGIWLLWMPRSRLAAAGAVAWVVALLILLLPVDETPGASRNASPASGASLTQATFGSAPDAAGFVYLVERPDDSLRFPTKCNWGDAWGLATSTEGRIRPLRGLYRDTSAAAEFVRASKYLPFIFAEPYPERPHWWAAWDGAGRPLLDSEAAAAALGARWLASCDPDGSVSLVDLPGFAAGGTTLVPYAAEAAWHQAAVTWWVRTAAGPTTPTADSIEPLPVLSAGVAVAYPPDQAARDVSLRAEGETLTVRAGGAGWAWLRVPWDPYWRALEGTPVLKGGPGHLVVWANEGVTQLRWSVPRSVDVAAASTTGAALLAVLGFSVVNRRRGFEIDPERRRPVADAIELFADTVDGWFRGGARRMRRFVRRRSGRES